jgi:APA family basic amino acid/polyamine antiporter
LRKAYGPLSGFLFGWILFLVAMGGSIAALGVGFAEYFGYFFPSLATDRIAFSKQIVVFSHDFNYSFSFGQIVAIHSGTRH